MSAPFLKWSYRAELGASPTVLPDGCRDVLILRTPDGHVDVSLSPLDLSPRTPDLAQGTEITGYRLRPGAAFPDDALRAIAASPSQASAVLTDALSRPDDLEDAVLALTHPGATAQSVSRALGVSPRTLQRRFRERGLPPPDFWRLLARVRKAAILLASPAALADIAYACGFSDQAHLSRELSRWLGCTPTALRRDPQLRHMLAQPALGAWTGEQISIR